MIAYHASNKKFDKFSLEQANTQNHKENFKALWFSTDREYIKQFGKIIYKVNIDTKNFLRESQYNKIDKLVHEFDSTCDDGIGVLETKRGQEFADFLVSKGYDGYIFPQNDGKTIICFNPNVVTILSSIDETLTVYNGGATKEDSDGLKYYALDKKYVKSIHPHAKINQYEIEPQNIFDYSNPKHVEMLLDKLPEKIVIKDNYRRHERTYSKEHFKRILEGDKYTFGNWNLLEDKTIQKIIKDLGFDSMYLLEYSFSGKKWKNIAMFENKNNKTSMKLKAYHGGNLDNGIHDGHLFFTDDIETAKLYGRESRSDYKLYQCDLEFENPLILNSEEYDEFMQSISDWNEPIQQGYDSIICEEDPEYNDPFYYVALNPVKQVKNLKEIKKDLKENLEELSDGIYATQSAYDILNLFKNKPKAYRVVYDKNNRYYFIGDALKYIHGDLISAAYDMGFYYEELKNNSRSEVMIYLGNCLEYQEVLMLSFFPKDFGDIKAIDNERSSDWYNHKYVYDFGTIYTQEACPLEEFDFYQLLGEPIEQEELELPESLFISLNRELEKFLCD